MNRLAFVVSLIPLAMAYPPATRAQAPHREPLLTEAGVYVVGRVIKPDPLTIDITAAEGLEVGKEVEILRPSTGWSPVGTMTVTEVMPGGAEGSLPPGGPRPEAGDGAVFHRSSEVPPEAERPAPPTIVVISVDATLARLRCEGGAIVAVGESLAVQSPDRTTGYVKITRVDKGANMAEATPQGAVKVGARATLRARVRVVDLSGQPTDPLVGHTVGIRFRDKRDGTSYFLVPVLAADRSVAGPVPALTVDFPGRSGGPPQRLKVEPMQIQQLVLFDAMDEAERTVALAEWEEELRDEQAGAPHREWEDVTRLVIQNLRRGRALMDLWKKPEPQKKGARPPRRGFSKAEEIF
jgi:hypothetical protein